MNERLFLYKCFIGLLALVVGLGGAFVVFFDVGHLGKPIVFAIDGAHVVDDGFQIQFFFVVFVRHVLKITKFGEIVLV